jgi:choline dehydrogenase-like flavoprotein
MQLPRDEYEYIVVGSGAGGGTLAARLAEAGKRVALLEAGGDGKVLAGADYAVPAFHGFASENETMRWDFFVRHYADEATQRADPKYRAEVAGAPVDGVLYPRAGTLGGCTAHNAMILVYPHNEDWEYIARLTGDESWRAPAMRRYFERLENCRHRPLQRLLSKIGINPTRHGWNGWLSTEQVLPREVLRSKDLVETIMDSAYAAFMDDGHRFQRLGWFLEGLLDPNDWRLVQRNAVGLRSVPLTTHKGERMGARERVLQVAEKYPDRLTVFLNALATRVLFDEHQRAVGVEYLQGERLYRAHASPSDAPAQTHTLRARREVILAGGAFNTPQLLMLSGIGSPETLRRHGIPVRVPLPGVGKNLQDRYEVGVVNRMNRDWDVYKGATFTPDDPQYAEWSRTRSGVYTANGAVVTLFRHSAVAAELPDLFCMSLLARFQGYYPSYARDSVSAHHYLTWMVLKAHTRNRAGEVTLRSADPRDMPRIVFHSFAQGGEEDLRAVLDGVRFVRKLAAPLRKQGLIVEEELPGDALQTDEELEAFIRANAWGHHASCTCPIGDPESGGVLRGDFRVHGTQGLRVVDASAFPRIPGFFIACAVYMIAEKAAEVILTDSFA